jgi:hypothetical protein
MLMHICYESAGTHCTLMLSETHLTTCCTISRVVRKYSSQAISKTRWFNMVLFSRPQLQRYCVLQLLVNATVVPSSLIILILMMEAICS